MLTLQELELLTGEERSNYQTAGAKDKAVMETTLKERVRRRAAERKIDLSAPVDARSLDIPVLAAAHVPAVGPATTRYGTARAVIGFLDFIGRLMMIVGGLWFAYSLYQVMNALARSPEYGYGAFSVFALLPSLGMVVGGVLIFAHGQTQRATLDTADLTRELLAETKGLARRNA